MKKVFIGIDFSKLKFDAAIYIVDTKQVVSEGEFKNEPSGYSDFLEWITENACYPKSSLLFCGEHTGYYSAN
ncbi:MAG: IS110 family transposase, partial [Bacteroidia bacterium]|nr:IS110 family transposase [Bacteroidia bacterium]